MSLSISLFFSTVVVAKEEELSVTFGVVGVTGVVVGFDDELPLPPKKSSRSFAIELLAVLGTKKLVVEVDALGSAPNESKSNSPGVYAGGSLFIWIR